MAVLPCQRLTIDLKTQQITLLSRVICQSQESVQRSRVQESLCCDQIKPAFFSVA